MLRHSGRTRLILGSLRPQTPLPCGHHRSTTSSCRSSINRRLRKMGCLSFVPSSLSWGHALSTIKDPVQAEARSQEQQQQQQQVPLILTVNPLTGDHAFHSHSKDTLCHAILHPTQTCLFGLSEAVCSSQKHGMIVHPIQATTIDSPLATREGHQGLYHHTSMSMGSMQSISKTRPLLSSQHPFRSSNPHWSYSAMNMPTKEFHRCSREHQHQQHQIHFKSIFVSKHNQSLQLSTKDLLDYCQQQGISTQAARVTATHVILQECPFCSKETRSQTDNMYKCYLQIGAGAYFCHRCGQGGSWYDLKSRLGKFSVDTVIDADCHNAVPATLSSSPLRSHRSHNLSSSVCETTACLPIAVAVVVVVVVVIAGCCPACC